jgi:TRAP-type mannitol/chloroaromatic compound transport system substrate-binding protein
LTIQNLGGVPSQIDGSDVFPALERGTIDASELVGPHDDEQFGLNRIAKYHYYPDWREGGETNH